MCGAGLYWKNCSLAENSMSAACPDLRLRNTTAGAVVEYAANEEYVEASGPLQTANVEETPSEDMLTVLDRLLEEAPSPAGSAGGTSAGDTCLPFAMQTRNVSARGQTL